jgi:hypothetical protein
MPVAVLSIFQWPAVPGIRGVVDEQFKVGFSKDGQEVAVSAWPEARQLDEVTLPDQTRVDSSQIASDAVRQLALAVHTFFTIEAVVG